MDHCSPEAHKVPLTQCGLLHSGIQTEIFIPNNKKNVTIQNIIDIIQNTWISPPIFV